MKNPNLRLCAVVLCAASLAACGGSGNLSIGGTITGLTVPDLVLGNTSNGSTQAVAALATTFAFSTLLRTDDSYNIVIPSQPAQAVCTVSNGSGKMSIYNVSTVAVACVTNTYPLGGTISTSGAGTTAGLVLVNGNSQASINNGIATFAPVAFGAPYGVSILTPPTDGSNCTISAGVGTMTAAGVSNVTVICNK